MQWTVIIPAKALPEAKSRLAPMTGDPHRHRQLVEAIRADTIAAAGAAAGVARIVIVVDRRDGVVDGGDPAEARPAELIQVTPGLDAAVREGAAFAAASWPADGVAALVGDLPALRPDELAQVLAAAAAHPHAFVPDAAGTGTTLLAAAPGQPPRPAFGPGSAGRHGVDAVALEAGAGLRNDVDTAADLQAAAALGLGPATTAVLADLAAGNTTRST